jgi:mono/diheme cytochrome c family protein
MKHVETRPRRRLPVTPLVILSLVLGVVGSVTNALAPQGASDEWKAPARQAKRTNPVPSDEGSIAAGKVVYEKECLSCHGRTGKGDGPQAKDLPKKCGDLSDPKLWAQTDGALFWKISEGRTPMPGYDKLLKDENDRWKVIHYIRTLAPKPQEGEKK